MRLATVLPDENQRSGIRRPGGILAIHQHGGGAATSRPLELDMAAIKRDFQQVELAAVCLCSGNRRGMFQPHVAGVEWGIGAMGHARWKGVRLRAKSKTWIWSAPGSMSVKEKRPALSVMR